MTQAISNQQNKQISEQPEIVYVGSENWNIMKLIKTARILEAKKTEYGLYAFPIVMDKSCLDAIIKLNDTWKMNKTPGDLTRYFFEEGLYDLDKKIANGCKLNNETVFGFIWITERLYANFFREYAAMNYNTNLSRVDNSIYIMNEILGKAVSAKEKVYRKGNEALILIEQQNKKLFSEQYNYSLK